MDVGVREFSAMYNVYCAVRDCDAEGLFRAKPDIVMMLHHLVKTHITSVGSVYPYEAVWMGHQQG